MTVATKTQPNYTTQAAASYKAAIDAITAVHDRMGGAFAAHEQDQGSPAPDLSVRVDAGFVLNGITLSEIAAQTVTGFTVPSSGQERIDRVVVDASTGVASRVAGTAVSGSPSATPPAIPAGSLPCCQVRMTSSATAVLNSMITDERVTFGMPYAAGNGISISGLTIATSLTKLTNSLSVDVGLLNTATFYDGPSVAQGTTGVFLATGQVTLKDNGAAVNYEVKLWDGTTVIDSAKINTDSAGRLAVIHLSGYITNPAGNIKISVRNITATTGAIFANESGAGKDSTLSVIKVGP